MAMMLITENEHLVAGTLRRVTFYNEENGWTVMTVETKDGEDVKLTGNCAERPVEGLYIEAEGLWTNHQKFGRQFKATNINIKPPADAEGLKKYLVEAIDEIGPETAKRIVEHFGDRAEAALADPALLSQVKGVTLARAQRICESWNSQMADRDTIIFLRGLGLGQAMALRAIKEFGMAEVRQAVEANPYDLIRIRGIGFTLADNVAKHLGVEATSPFRIRAGIKYALEQRSTDGHTVATMRAIEESASQVLAIPESFIAPEAEMVVKAGTLAERQTPMGKIYALRHLDRAERDLASDVQRLMSAKFPSRKIPTAEEIEETFGFKPDIEQMDAIKMALTNGVSILTGGPGCGKTTMTLVVAALMGSNVRLAAPTGRAAKRLAEATGRQASTIHRLLETVPEDGRFVFLHNRSNPLEITNGLIIIDEVSMLDTELASDLFEAILMGNRVLLVGDPDQLPSVGPGNVLADLIAAGVPTVALKRIHRQGEGSPIPFAAKAVISGEMPEMPREGDYRCVGADNPEILIREVGKMISGGSIDDIQVLVPMRKGPFGADYLNYRLQKVLNPKGLQHGGVPSGRKVHLSGEDSQPEYFCVGDRVMQTANNYQLNIYNGDLFTVLETSAQGEKVRWMKLRRQDDGEEVMILSEDFGEVRLAYASTIHKAQGSQFKHVILGLVSAHYVMLTRRLVYTAMTRAQKTLTIVGESKAIKLALRDVGSVKGRDTGLRGLLPLAA